MRTPYTLALLASLFSVSASAQSYCEPSFANGCFNWWNMAISVGGLNWQSDAVDCPISDYVIQSATVGAGQQSLMEVTNGVWCGCAVWVDLDNSQSFEENENLYTSYQGADPSQTYSFMLDIPGDVATGAYRMRVIAPWGSDGVTPGSANGSGPCGSYQYGNFTDLTLNVIASTGLSEVTVPELQVSPNPGSGVITLQAQHALANIEVISADGRSVHEAVPVPGTTTQLDLSHLPEGTYILRGSSSQGPWQVRWVKQ